MKDYQADLPAHTFKNTVYLRRVGNRDLVHIEVEFRPHKLFGREKCAFILIMLPRDFERLAVLFPGCKIIQSNGYPAIGIKLALREHHKVYISTVLDYLEQLEEYRSGKLTWRPTTKGFYTACLDGNPWLLTPENRERRDARADRKKTSWKTGWTIDHRLRQIALGKDPNAPKEFSRGLAGFLLRSGKGGLLGESFARKKSGLEEPPSSSGVPQSPQSHPDITGHAADAPEEPESGPLKGSGEEGDVD